MSEDAAPSLCPVCGGSVRAGAERCPWCDTWLQQGGPPPPAPGATPSSPPSPRVLALRPVFLALALLAVLPLSILGWLLERPGTWWSSDAAIAVWCGLVPAWTLLCGLLWRPRHGRVLGVFCAFLLAALPFLSAVILRTGRLNDDAFGLAALVGGCAAGGLLLGMLGNRWFARRYGHSTGSIA
ncbi:MAG: hypothetical protein ABIO70_21395 [Pseudomonadota bacterium]